MVTKIRMGRRMTYTTTTTMPTTTTPMLLNTTPPVSVQNQHYLNLYLILYLTVTTT